MTDQNPMYQKLEGFETVIKEHAENIVILYYYINTNIILIYKYKYKLQKP